MIQGPINTAYHAAKGMHENVDRVYLEMDAGDTVLFHPLLIHGSGANRTKGYRKAISCHYAASECEYIAVKGTTQENIAQEVAKMAKKQFGIDISVDDYPVSSNATSYSSLSAYINFNCDFSGRVEVPIAIGEGRSYQLVTAAKLTISSCSFSDGHKSVDC